MFEKFEPNYINILNAAKNIKPERLPLYEHNISPLIMEKIMNKKFSNCMDNDNDAKIDAKHSNEDSIAPFSEWIDRYGDKIGNFGGLDTNILCDVEDICVEDYVKNVVEYSMNKKGGVAIGSGNSIPDYVSPQKYLTAVNTVRKMRGDK